MMFSVNNILIISIGYVVCLFGGHFIVSKIVNRYWKMFLPKLKQYHPLPMIIGFLDRFIYLSSILIGPKEFVAVWLIIKMAGEWNQKDDDHDRPMYHLFLLGNGLNVIIGVFIGLAIKLLVGTH